MWLNIHTSGIQVYVGKIQKYHNLLPVGVVGGSFGKQWDIDFQEIGKSRFWGTERGSGMLLTIWTTGNPPKFPPPFQIWVLPAPIPRLGVRDGIPRQLSRGVCSRPWTLGQGTGVKAAAWSQGKFRPGQSKGILCQIIYFWKKQMVLLTFKRSFLGEE